MNTDYRDIQKYRNIKRKTDPYPYKKFDTVYLMSEVHRAFDGWFIGMMDSCNFSDSGAAFLLVKGSPDDLRNCNEVYSLESGYIPYQCGAHLLVGGEFRGYKYREDYFIDNKTAGYVLYFFIVQTMCLGDFADCNLAILTSTRESSLRGAINIFNKIAGEFDGEIIRSHCKWHNDNSGNEVVLHSFDKNNDNIKNRVTDKMLKDIIVPPKPTKKTEKKPVKKKIKMSNNVNAGLRDNPEHDFWPIQG
jgi:hypothetical protein